MPERPAVGEREVLDVGGAGVRRSDEEEHPRPVAPARGEERLDRVEAEVRARGRRVGERRAVVARLEQRLGVGARGRADVAALGVDEHEETRSARVVAHLLERPVAVGAERLEERGLRLHRHDVRADGVHDSLAEARDGRRRRGAAEHGLAAQLHRQEVEARIQPDDELAVLARDGRRRAGRRSSPDRARPTGYARLELGARAAQTGTSRRMHASSGREACARSRRRRGDRPHPRARGDGSVAVGRREARLDLEPPRGTARDRPRRHAPTRDDERAPEAGLARGREHAELLGTKPVELLDPSDDRLQRSDPVAQPRGVLEAEVAGEPAQLRAERLAARLRGPRPRSRRARARRAAPAACSRSGRSASARRRRPSARPAAGGTTADGRPARSPAGGARG